MLSSLKEEKGFTYVEVLVASVILGLIFTSAFFVYQQGIRYWDTGDAKIELQQSLRVALDRLARDLRGAAPGTVVISANKIEFNIGSDKRIYEVSNNSLRYKTITPTSLNPPFQPLADYIDQMNLTLTGKLIEIELLGSLKGVSERVTTKIYLRID